MEKFIRQKTTTEKEDSNINQLVKLFKETSIPDNEILFNLGVYIPSRALSRILLMDFLFKQVLTIHGEVMDFGTRWGNIASIFISLRSIYEPFNRHRKVTAFDTFEGLKGVEKKDGNKEWMKDGSLNVSEDYEKHLEAVMNLKEKFEPISHFKKYEILKGDAVINLKDYFKRHPESIISLAFFDMDIYKPTKECLEILKEHLTKGSIIAFDELNEPESAGETIALKEVFGLSKYSIKRYQFASRVAYIVID